MKMGLPLRQAHFCVYASKRKKEMIDYEILINSKPMYFQPVVVGPENFMEMKKWARSQGYETEQEGWSTSAVCRDGIRRPFHYIELYLPIKR